MFFPRSDRSVLTRWWWQVDRISFIIILALISIGIILNFSATPSIATHLGLEPFYFVKRHISYVVPSLCILVFLSTLSSIQIRKVCFLIFIVTVLMLISTPFVGTEIKGAKRWLSIYGISIQVSEFIKPVFSVFIGWMILKQEREPNFPGLLIVLISSLLIIFFLFLQPDLGMTIVISASIFCQLFVAGMPYTWVIILSSSAFSGFCATYLIFPHVRARIEGFLSGEQYQVSKSLEAFSRGGFLGQGPGEGTIKHYVPDAHCDFIFSVAGEEFGLIMCLLIVTLFLILFYRTISRIQSTNNLFCLIACTGILTQISLQTFINLASSLNLIPTKGMTLPFISYGGSSILALALSCSVILSLTRH